MKKLQTVADKNQILTAMVSPAKFPLLEGNAKFSDHHCDPPVVLAIENLRSALHAAYRTDFAFSVAGNGHILGASNAGNGVVIAKTLPTPLITIDNHD